MLLLGCISTAHLSNVTKQSIPPVAKIITGADKMNDYIHLLKNKKIALVINQTSYVGERHLLDSLLALKINVVRVFAPEHGFRGEESAGAIIKDQKDARTGIPIISLYGKKKKPSRQDLDGVEYVVFDIQDVGVRFFTFISTLHYVMESCAEFNIPLLVLDRPNPNGHYIDGPVLDTNFKSFVGIHPIPIVYGMTIGELARMIHGEKWIKYGDRLRLKVIKCSNYHHQSKVVLKIKPSPNLPNERAILLYPSLCFFEGTVVSLGRGTDIPFQIYGHPRFTNYDTVFTPMDRVGAMDPPQEGIVCKGINLSRLNIDTIRSMRQIQLGYFIDAYKQLNLKDSFFLSNLFIDKLSGTDLIRKSILANKDENAIRQSWQRNINIFKNKRSKYLLYKD